MSPLLLLTDFSETGNHAVEYGYHLAKCLKTNVLLCNAVNLTDKANVLWPIEANSALVDNSLDELRKLKMRLKDSDHHMAFYPKIDYFASLGELLEVVSGLRKMQTFSIVVIGAHRTGFGRFLVENHCKSMIESLNCPLLIVPKEAPLSDVKKIAFATDYKDHKRDLDNVYRLIPIAERMEAVIMLAHIHKGEIKNKKAIEKVFLTELSNEGNYPIFYSCMEHDQADDGLCAMCSEQQVDMLVMLHRSRNFIEMIFKGSHTHKVAEKVTVPLMVIPE
ncbi:universal stress protein [Pedobacter sp. ASV1-7]|uniref:universal stress protein n=1 Tax=Pedobacter sp. ASV1-7 TaxID=3145237 RepID=UPI0032E8FAA7